MTASKWLWMALVTAGFTGCGASVMGPGDGGTGTDGSTTSDSATAQDGAVNPTDPLTAPPQCSSTTMWRNGNRGSNNMNPGQACNACHEISRGAPTLSIAGTVYRTGHEPNNCNGGAASGTVTIEITDANGQVHNLTPFAPSGNFYLEQAIPGPYRARVLYDGRVRAMHDPQTNGDCNVCHTQSGAMGAPGRIVLP